MNHLERQNPFSPLIGIRTDWIANSGLKSPKAPGAGSLC